jgi:hypothetical protein
MVKMPRKGIIIPFYKNNNINVHFIFPKIENRGGYEGGGYNNGGGYGGGYGGGESTTIIEDNGWFGRDKETIITEGMSYKEVILMY